MGLERVSEVIPGTVHRGRTPEPENGNVTDPCKTGKICLWDTTPPEHPDDGSPRCKATECPFVHVQKDEEYDRIEDERQEQFVRETANALRQFDQMRIMEATR